jgi:hypothetical protein
MTRPFSLRARPSVIAAMDARAARLGQRRTQYILSLVDRDLAAEKSPRQHRFASADLIGSLQTGLKTGDNATVRRLARQRLHEKHR